MTTQPDAQPQPALEVLWPDERIINSVYRLTYRVVDAIALQEMRAMMYKVRDEYEAIRNAQYQERQRLAAQVASLTERVQGLIVLNNENAEIGARHMHLGNATMNIAVATVADMKAKDARIARLERELATAQDGASGAWVPVEYDHIYTRLAEPVRPDYEKICEKWHEFNESSCDTDDGYEYSICRRQVAPDPDRAGAEGAGGDLLPCPFCATIPEIYDADKLIADEDGDWAGVRCETCGALGPPIETDGRESADCVDDAVAAWNRRTTAQQATAVGGRE